MSRSMTTSPTRTTGRAPARGLRRLLLGVAVLAATAGTLAVASPAQAAGRDGVCDAGEFCYYYNSNEAGSVSDFTGSVANYGATQPSCYVFKGPGAGQGLCIKNDAASVWNRASVPVTVYYNSNYGGTSQTIPAGAKANLIAALKNNDASHLFGTSSGGGTVTGATAVARAQVWVNAGIPYNQSGYYQGYREDCSGYVSMAWGLPTPGLTTPYFTTVGHYISASQLQRGDALLNPAAGNAGHIVLFSGWANTAHTAYYGYEETGSHGAIYRQIPYPYWSGYGTFTPFHFNGLG